MMINKLIFHVDKISWNTIAKNRNKFAVVVHISAFMNIDQNNCSYLTLAGHTICQHSCSFQVGTDTFYTYLVKNKKYQYKIKRIPNPSCVDRISPSSGLTSYLRMSECCTYIHKLISKRTKVKILTYRLFHSCRMN